jgi:hypothetical protein
VNYLLSSEASLVCVHELTIPSLHVGSTTSASTRKDRSSESLEQFVVSHRGFKFQQVFLIFRIVFGDFNINISKSHNGVARFPKAKYDEVRCITVYPA